MHPTTPNPLIVSADAGRCADFGDHRGRLLVGAESTGGTFALFAMDVDPDGGVPPHVHFREDETFHVLSGRFEFLIGEQTAEIGPGDTVLALRAISHAWRCISAEGGRMLLQVTPGANFERFAFQMAEAGIVPSDPDGIAGLIILAQRHGIEMLPPGK